MQLRLYNTMARKIEDFYTIEPGKAKMYTCGPTVYNYAHIGNLRTYVSEDLLRRTLEYVGYEVEHVMNVTDVGHLTDDADEGEDKMVKSSRESGRSVWDIAQFYTDAFFLDIDNLNIRRPSITCKATDHIGDMVGLIKKIEQNGHTYESGGNVYFSIDTFPEYGKLARLDTQDLQSGARIAVDSNKKNPRDFVLWFTRSKFENQAMIWDSPWGKGYPGWHVECSAMSMRYLGEHFDIHCGGVDHIPVHHTNEIAQSESATGKKWVNFWIHAEFLVMGQHKMAKSKGNFITLRTLQEEKYDPLDYRYFCLGGHYRSQLQFTFDSLDAARTARLNLVDRVRELRGEVDTIPELTDIGSEARRYLEEFQTQVTNDLHVPKALSVLWPLLKDSAVPAGEKLAVVLDMDKVLGLQLASVEEEASLDDETHKLIKEREEARAAKDFARADQIRDQLLEKGIELKDTPKGTVWKKKV
ncbi:MAG: cysteine--tRNA ligase [Spirochaetia bacterium]|nr:cysteine--tRNA ligase [Spirochaetia bacterium]